MNYFYASFESGLEKFNERMGKMQFLKLNLLFMPGKKLLENEIRRKIKLNIRNIFIYNFMCLNLNSINCYKFSCKMPTSMLILNYIP